MPDDIRSQKQQVHDGETGDVSPSSIGFDMQAYMKILHDSDLSVAEKEAFLQALWSIIVEFVSLGFGVHPIQQAMADDPMYEMRKNKSTNVAAPMLSYGHSIIEHEIIQSAGGKSKHSDPAYYDREV